MSDPASLSVSGVWVSVVLPEQRWPSWPEWLLVLTQKGSVLEGTAEYYGQYRLQPDFSYVVSGSVDGTQVYLEFDCSELVDTYEYFSLSFQDNSLAGERLEGSYGSSRVLFLPSKMVSDEWGISRSYLV